MKEHNTRSDTIVVVSLGQLIHPDIKKSIRAFSELVATKSSFLFFSTIRTYLALFLDKIWYHTIDDYKKGLIDSDIFRKRLCKQLGIKKVKSEEFDAAWNAMCAPSDETKQEIREFLKEQKEHGFKLAIITGSNQIHSECLKKQVPELFAENDKISFIKSFEKHTLSVLELVKSAVQPYDSKEYTIVLCLHDVKAQTLSLKEAKVVFHDLGKGSVCDQIKRLGAQDSGYSQNTVHSGTQESPVMGGCRPDSQVSGARSARSRREKEEYCVVM